MELKIQRDGNFSIHIQLKEQIKGFILNGVLKEESQLPTVRQIENILRINKNTVLKVYQELEKEGYVYSIKGKGTFVKKKKNIEKMKEFISNVDLILRKAYELDIDTDEIWGMIYYRSQKQKIYNSKLKNNGFIFVECNKNSIDDFKKICKKEIKKDINIEGILIKDIKENFDIVKKQLENFDFLVIPYLHYEEVKKELKKLKKEVFTIGTNQSFKIMSFSNKLKRKNVGIIGLSYEDEKAISKQFEKAEVNEFLYFSETNNEFDEFEKKSDAFIVYSEVISKVNFKFKKPFFIFEGKYDIEDMRIIKEIFL